jgi:hypothetical protein
MRSLSPMHVFAFSIALAAALTPLIATAAPGRAQTTDSATRIDAYMRGRMPNLRTPGLAVVVVDGDQVIFSRGYGLADRDGWAAYTGEYQTFDGTLRVYQEDDKLLGFVAGVHLEFIQQSDTTFIMLSNLSALDEVPAEFQRQADGSVVLQFTGRPFAVKK